MALQSQLGITDSTMVSGTIGMGYTSAVDPLDATATDSLVFAELAVDGISGPAEDSLAFSEVAAVGSDYEVAAVDTLTYSELAFLDLVRSADTLSMTEDVSAASSEWNAVATDTLVLSEQASVILSADDTLSLTESADHIDTADDTLTFSQVVNVTADYSISSADTFSMAEVVGSVAEYCTFVTDELDEFEDQYDPVTNTITNVQIGGFRDSATAAGPINTSALDTIFFVEVPQGWIVPPDGPGVFTDTASDTWTLTERAAQFDHDTFGVDTLSMTESATEDTGPRADGDTIAYTESASSGLEFTAAAEDTWTIQEELGFVHEETSKRSECIYDPQVGSDDFPLAYEGIRDATGGFQLLWPTTGTPTDSVSIRNPSFGNRTRLDLARVNQETRGGTLIIFADPIWPKKKRLLLSFSSLTEAKGKEIKTFLKAHLGVSIRLIDHEGREWIGVVVNPNDPLVQDGRGCQFTYSFEFEGERTGNTALTASASDDLQLLEATIDS